MVSKEEILKLLEQVRDPEIPLLSVIDMGIIRDVLIENCPDHSDASDTTRVVVKITPTYSGCPAMHLIEEEVLATLHANGFPSAKVEVVLSPAWTTEWLSAAAREKLKASAIAPPAAIENGLVQFPPKKIACPFCNSKKTELRSEFGCTACKSLCFCKECNQPFEYFKSL